MERAPSTWNTVPVPPLFDDFPYGRDTPRLSPTGTHVAVGVYRPSGGPDLLVYDVASGALVDGAGGSDFYSWSSSGDVWASDVRVTAAETYGARLEIRLDRPAQAGEAVLVEVWSEAESSTAAKQKHSP